MILFILFLRESINSLRDENIDNIVTTFLKYPKLFLVLGKIKRPKYWT